LRVAVVGATGLVGEIMAKVLEERNFPVTEFLPVASERSIGKEVVYKSKKYKVIGLEEALALRPAIALFSAGGSVSLEWAPKFAAAGTTVIDNSSAWRMEPDKPLIVPEINADLLTKEDKIIANPNCSTIQLVMALAPLHEKYVIQRLVVSTYQSVSGTGLKAIQQLESEEQNGVFDAEKSAYFHPIHRNAIPHCDSFTENGYTKEEMKVVNETRKILRDQNIGITVTAVRVPVVGGHSESVNITFKKPFVLSDVKELLSNTYGITVMDEPERHIYPMPLLSQNKDDVFVGRIRRDESVDNGINMWIVADNLRKGAATNAVQIAEYLLEHRLV